MRDLIKVCFNESINEIFEEKYPDLKKAVLENSAKEKFFDNMTYQLRKVEARGKVQLTRKKIKDIVKDFTKLLAQAAIKKLELDKGIKESKSRVFIPPTTTQGFKMIRAKKSSKYKQRKSGILMPRWE